MNIDCKISKRTTIAHLYRTMGTAWDRRPKLVEDVIDLKDGEVLKKGWLDTARLPSWNAMEVRDKCFDVLRDGMTQTALLHKCGGESAARYTRFSKKPTMDSSIIYALLAFHADRENAVRAPWTEDELVARREKERKRVEKEENKANQVCKACGFHARHEGVRGVP